MENENPFVVGFQTDRSARKVELFKNRISFQCFFSNVYGKAPHAGIYTRTIENSVRATVADPRILRDVIPPGSNSFIFI